MAYEYSNNEYTEMVRLLAKSQDNATRACHEFHPGPSEMVSVEDGDEQDSEEDEENEEEEEDEEEENEEQEEEKEVPRPKLKNKPIEPPLALPASKGFPLGRVSNVQTSLTRFTVQEQKILHQYLYGQLCTDRNITGNIKNFKGFQWTINSTEYKAKLMETARMDPRQLRAMCEMLDLEKSGGPSELATRLMDFLHQLREGDKEVSRASPVKKDNRGTPFVPVQRRTRSHSPARVTRRESESDQDTKANDYKDGSESSDDSGNSSVLKVADSQFEGGTEGREAESKALRDRETPLPNNKKSTDDMLKRMGKGKKVSSDESYEETESSEEESEEEEESKEEEGSDGEEESDEDEGSEEDERNDEEESDEESDTPADKKAKLPPTDKDIKKYLKQILDGADLEQITMKTVCKKVYNHYSEFDLEHKEDYIKAAVKSLL